jgi:hypothetical protein
LHIELNKNRIVIVLTDAETNFITNKATAAGQKDTISYIKTKLLKALELKGFEDSAIVNLANNFNLAKIKHVSTELNRRKTAPATYLPGTSKSDSDDLEDFIEDFLKEELPAEEQDPDLSEADAEVVDDLLSGLLDQDLLKGSKKHQSGDPKAQKTRKHYSRPRKTED